MGSRNAPVCAPRRASTDHASIEANRTMAPLEAAGTSSFFGTMPIRCTARPNSLALSIRRLIEATVVSPKSVRRNFPPAGSRRPAPTQKAR